MSALMVDTVDTIPGITSATFRAWCLQLSNALTSIGLLKTTDTGQIDLTTVAVPGAINTVAGYEIRAFQDPTQATAPIYVKIEYGTGTSTTICGLWITVGGSTNGAGTLGNILRARTQHNGNPAGSSSRWFLAYRAGYFLFSRFNYNLTSFIYTHNVIFCLVRSVDNTNVPDNRGLIVHEIGNSTTSPINLFIYTAAVPAAIATYDSTRSTLIPGGLTSVAVGIDTQYFIHWMRPGRVCPVVPILTLMTGALAEMTINALTPISGVTKNYLAFDVKAGTAYGGDTNFRYAVEYD